MCRGGNDSRRACKFLLDNGYESKKYSKYSIAYLTNNNNLI